jgi:hypothetical protein
MPKNMLKMPQLVLSSAVALGIMFLAETSNAVQPAAGLIGANVVLPVQNGPGSGTGTGRCRWVRIPGSGQGPQWVCDRGPRCRTIVIPGSGRGPQRVCD